ncbi:hypothetical protein LCGC14_2312880 [marine sediment metagenome]|uniref:Homeodomain phBC6A51-type domain-containing protein n=1 Tax=marine sediment metagenome TaxID=412755 RepID=A0A0F9CK52_9ZZZZ
MARKRDKKGQFIASGKDGEKDLQKFTPSSPMKKWLVTSFDLGYGASVSTVSKAAKVSRRSWYNWIEIDQFVKWWDGMWQKHLMGMRWRLDAIGMKKAEKEYEYWKEMMVRTGNLAGEQEGTSPQAQVNIFTRLAKDDREFVEGEEVK